MKLTREEEEVIRNLRAGSRALNDEVPTNKNVKGNLLSQLDVMLSLATQSKDPVVREEALKVQQQVHISGYNSLAEVPPNLVDDNQIQALINLAYGASQVDSELAPFYDGVKESAIFYDTGMTDEEFEEASRLSMQELKNEDMNSRVEEIPIVNELTGKQYIQRIYPDGTKEIVEYNPEAEYQATIEEAEAEFLEAIQGGASPDMVNFNQGLVDK